MNVSSLGCLVLLSVWLGSGCGSEQSDEPAEGPCPTGVTCPAQRPDPGSSCPSVCDSEPCEYEAETACGVRAVNAVCVSEYEILKGSWQYVVEGCELDCTSVGDEPTCTGRLGCVWLTPCPDSPVQGARCAAMPVGSNVDCSCPDGVECVTMHVDPRLPEHSDCDGAGALVRVCP